MNTHRQRTNVVIGADMKPVKIPVRVKIRVNSELKLYRRDLQRSLYHLLSYVADWPALDVLPLTSSTNLVITAKAAEYLYALEHVTNLERSVILRTALHLEKLEREEFDSLEDV